MIVIHISVRNVLEKGYVSIAVNEGDVQIVVGRIYVFIKILSGFVKTVVVAVFASMAVRN